MGLSRGLFSKRCRNGWPCNIWAVSKNQVALEARLDNDQGIYHGFPMMTNDPLYTEIITYWGNNDE